MYLPLGAWIFRNFKPELLLNGKRHLSSTASLMRAWPKQCWKSSCKRIQKCWEFKRLTCFKFSTTTCNRVCKRTQHIHATMLSPFARGFRGKRNQTRALQHDGFVPQEYTNELQRALYRGPVNFSLIYNWWWANNKLLRTSQVKGLNGKLRPFSLTFSLDLNVIL